ncbi:MAG: hypothetical protein JRH20_26420 [Deltaproteobacteria bacterium]|nr:hypothetical protein [Deltaproteobacteria bacterium]
MRHLLWASLLLLATTTISSARQPLRHPPLKTPSARLPADAQRIVDRLATARDRIYRAAEAKLAPLRSQAAAKLKRLQDRYTRAAKLDQAVAIRAQRRGVLGIRTDPGNLRALATDVGRSFLYEVTGSNSGALWGSKYYTTDSHLGTATVHAGLLKMGQRGLVKVRIHSGRQSYKASTAHGIKSLSYGNWSLSFTLEPAAEMKKRQSPKSPKTF